MSSGQRKLRPMGWAGIAVATAGSVTTFVGLDAKAFAVWLVGAIVLAAGVAVAFAGSTPR